MYRLPFILSGLLAPLAAIAVSESNQLEYRFDFSGTVTPSLTVENVWGDVRVTTHNQPYIQVFAKETRSADDRELFEKSKEVLYLTINENSDSVELIVDGIVRNWNRRNPCPDCSLEYQFDIRVPANTNLDVSTVNDGEVLVTDVQGTVHAANINGGVKVENAAVCGEFSSINGPVDVSFNQPPSGDCSYETINGDIEVVFPDRTDADLSFRLHNGSVSSEINVQPLAMEASVKKSQKKGRYRYQFRQPAGVRIGGGGPRHHFESMNGDLLIKRR